MMEPYLKMNNYLLKSIQGIFYQEIKMNRLKILLILVLVFFVNTSTFCQYTDSLNLSEGLVIKLNLSGNNNILSPDPIAALIETGNWDTPSENDELEYNNKIIGRWNKINADENGWIKDDSLTDAYIQYIVSLEKDEVVLVEAMGNTALYVNGSAHSGNPYRYQDNFESWGPRFDYSMIPVKLKKGKNELLFKCDRSLLKVKILKNISNFIFNTRDLTIPNPIINEGTKTFGALPIINSTDKFYKNLSVKSWAEGSSVQYYPVNGIVPLSISKIPFIINLPAYSQQGTVKLNLELVSKEKSNEIVLASTVIELQIVNHGETRKETFISKIDGSVQYYSVNPPENLKLKPALFLSLHGAGVEAINQAQSYGHKNWGYVVSPTNRRPYGYNWENWGRLDALEVLDIAKKKFDIDEDRIYLTGHSMGGHGTWHLGVNYPDKFAAIAPSAGWISIWSYRIKPQHDSSEVDKLLLRSTKQSDTYAFTENLKPNGIYIIHGDADDNVPLQQAESMIENLSKFHKDFVSHIEPGAGHWWDNSDEPGADCVDWRPMFDFFAHHSIANNEQVKEIEFTTANPVISSKNYWIEIINQIKQQTLSKINIKLEQGNRKFVGTTENIQMLSIDASMLTNDKLVSVELDKQLITGIIIPDGGKIYLHRNNDNWMVSKSPVYINKYPSRCGNLREAFNNNVLFVYGSHGNKSENDWALEKAKLDAEKVWYRGNSSIQIIKDDDFDLITYKDRNVILFGNSKTNSAWKLLLDESPVQVDNKKISVADKVYNGSDFACLMIRPRKDSDVASVGVISATGIDGMKLVNLVQYFDQYVGFPDVVIFNSGILTSDDQGVKFIGYFGNDWSIEKGEFVIR
jgi:poly(3-hydroxybutyrate) depolymerase